MIELPLELQTMLIALIAGAVAYVVTNGIVELGKWFGKDFGVIAKRISAVASTAAVAFSLDLVNIALVSIPPEYADITSGIFALLIAFLAATGIHKKATG